MRFNPLSLLICALAALLLTSSCTGPRDKFDRGKVENGVYHNKYFRLTMPVPAGWDARGFSGVPMMTDTVPGIPRIRSTAEMQGQTAPSPLRHLLNLTTTSIDTGHTFHPTLLLKAERAADESVSSEPYSQLIGRTQTHLLPDLHVSAVDREEIDRQTFTVLHTDISTEYGATHIDYYTALMRGYYLTFICTYNDEADKDALRKMRQSVVFSVRAEG